MTDLMAQFRHSLATEGDIGMLIAADAFGDSNDCQNVAFGELLRIYVEMNRHALAGQTVPGEMLARFQELNETFRVDGEIHGLRKQLGPFWTRLEISQRMLLDNIRVLDDQPIRELLIHAPVTNDIHSFLRSRRMSQIKVLELGGQWGRVAEVAATVKHVEVLQANSLTLLRLQQVNDRLKTVEFAFRLNRTITKGCQLFFGSKFICRK